MGENIGPDGHPVPEKQGIVTAEIQPIPARDVMKNVGRGIATAKGSALYLPNFVTPPRLIAGTEAKDAEGNMIAGTGIAEPDSIECVPLTLEKGHEAAMRVLENMHKMPLSELSVDLMNLAFSLLHHENQAKKGGGQ